MNKHLLTQAQVEMIAAEVKSAGITIPHLADDLIDHICCEVENEIGKGKCFEEAYQKTRQKAGIKILKQIQDNTLFLIDKNYRLMKMTMKITGNVSLAMLGLATVMRLFHWPGANIVLVLGFIVLALIFYPSAIWSSYRDSKIRLSKTLHSTILAGGILLMAGVLFKVMHWPGAGVIISSGWLFAVVLFLPLLIYAKMTGASSWKDRLIICSGAGGLMIYELSSIFRMFHWPGASILMVAGTILIISVFLPLYSATKFREEGKITGSIVFINLLAVYFILLTMLVSINRPPGEPATEIKVRQETEEGLPPGKIQISLTAGNPDNDPNYTPVN